MAISSDALAFISAKMRGNCNAGVVSTTKEVGDALETYKDDLKTIEKKEEKEAKKNPF